MFVLLFLSVRWPSTHSLFDKVASIFGNTISGNDALYFNLIKPLGYTAKQRNLEFSREYAQIVNKFTIEFSKDFVTADGKIDWESLVKFNSAA